MLLSTGKSDCSSDVPTMLSGECNHPQHLTHSSEPAIAGQPASVRVVVDAETHLAAQVTVIHGSVRLMRDVSIAHAIPVPCRVWMHGASRGKCRTVLQSFPELTFVTAFVLHRQLSLTIRGAVVTAGCHAVLAGHAAHRGRCSKLQQSCRSLLLSTGNESWINPPQAIC